MRIFQPTVTGSNTTTGSLHISGPVYFYTLETSSVFHILTYNTSSGQVFYTASEAIGRRPGEPDQSIQFNGGGEFSGSTNFTFNGTDIVYLTGSMLVSGAISASFGPNTVGFFGTASWAQSASNALTASVILNPYPISVTGSTLYSIAPISGIPSLNSTISSIFFGTGSGLGATNASQSVFLGEDAGRNAPSAHNSNFLGNTAGRSANNARYSNFLGAGAGFGATNARSSNFLGQNAGSGSVNARYSNFLGEEAGLSASSADNSNFLGQWAGQRASNARSSNFLGSFAGLNATNADNSNFFGDNAGYGSTNAKLSNFIGAFAGGSIAANASQSNFLGYLAGAGATNAHNSNFIGGANTGRSAINASYSTLIGYQVGYVTSSTSIGSNNIIIGTNITLSGSKKDSINIGGIIFGTGSYSITTGNPFSGSAGGKIGINVVEPTYNLHVSGTVAFPNLTTSSQVNVVIIDTASGQLFYTASNTVGGGGIPGPPFSSIQFNNNGFFAGSSDFTINNTAGSIQQGFNVTASGSYSHAEGQNTIAYGVGSHAEGKNTVAGWSGFDVASVSNILYTAADIDLTSLFPDSPGKAFIFNEVDTFYLATYTSVTYTPSVGSEITISSPTLVDGTYAVADINNLSSPLADSPVLNSLSFGPHSQGSGSQAAGHYSNTSGWGTLALGQYQSIFGQYNNYNLSQSAFIIGDGTSITDRHNVLFVSKSHFEVSASNTYLQGLTSSNQTHILVYNTSSGQVYYTASSAIGGGGSGTPAPSDTYIQYNSASSFGAEKDFRYIYESHSLQQGNGVIASGFWSHAQGSGSIASGEYSHAEGGAKIIIFGWEFTEAIGTGSHAEGAGSIAFGNASHAEGRNTYTFGDYSHTEGLNTYTSKSYSHAEGWFTSASGLASHAEGNFTKTIKDYSHAEGFYTITSGNYSHAEGSGSITLGIASHAEGRDTVAEGDYSHAEGYNTIAIGDYSHAGGFNTTSSGIYQTVVGQNNAPLTSQSAFIVGGGLTSVNKSNAFVVVPQTILTDSVLEILIDSASISASVLHLNNLPTSPETHLLLYNTSSGQVYYTASSAVGGGSSTFNSTSSLIGNGAATTWNINHGFNTRNLHITVYESSSNGETVYPDIRRINENTASIIFANPPSTDQYIVYISQ